MEVWHFQQEVIGRPGASQEWHESHRCWWQSHWRAGRKGNEHVGAVNLWNGETSHVIAKV